MFRFVLGIFLSSFFICCALVFIFVFEFVIVEPKAISIPYSGRPPESNMPWPQTTVMKIIPGAEHLQPTYQPRYRNKNRKMELAVVANPFFVGF